MSRKPVPVLSSALSILLLACLLPALASADGWLNRLGKNRSIEGSGVMETRTLELDGFDTIRVDGVATVDVTIGDDFRVELEAEDNLIDLVEARVSRGRLIIETDDDTDIDTDEGFHFTITMPSLVEVDGNGVYEFHAEGLDNDRTVVHAQGVGNVVLVGKTEFLEVELSGVGNVELRDLIAQEANVEVDGVGNVEVYVEEELDAEADGLGSIRFFGNPVRVRDHADGFGSIRAGD